LTGHHRRARQRTYQLQHCGNTVPGLLKDTVKRYNEYSSA